MRDILEKLVALFCIIVFLTFLVNHGALDFSGVDWVIGKTKEAVTSEKGQEYVEETKEISKNVFAQMFDGIKSTISKIFNSDEENDVHTSTNTDSSPTISDTAIYLSTQNGNTILVNMGDEEKSVKLLGIKSASGDYSEESKEYLSKIMENVNTIYLEYDVNKNDPDNNLMAYVWINNEAKDMTSNMINAIMLDNGYATDSVYLPNNKYTDKFMEICASAKTANKGLWAKNGFN